MHRIRRHLSFSNVIACVALFVALGGGAYALTVPRNSVRTEQIKNGEVRSQDIRDGTIRGNDIYAGTRRALRAAGPPGPQGPPGPSPATFRAAVDATNGLIRERSSNRTGMSYNSTIAPGEYTVTFGDATMNTCVALVTVGAAGSTPLDGWATVADAGGGVFVVRTRDATGAPAPRPFFLQVSC